MAAFVTDQFRILNASNFIDSISDSNNSFYTFLGLSNPTTPNPGFGRTSDWDTNTPSPIDNLQYLSHYRDTSLFGKKVTTENAVRVVRKIEWVQGNRYDMYRHDYSNLNPAPVSGAIRLYDANYYVITSSFKVYICIDNGSSGSISPRKSLNEPTQTTPGVFSTSDGYRWKYLFTVSPSNIIKFDSTQYIPLPNNWDTNSETQVVYINGVSGKEQQNQIKQVYIESGGTGYTSGPANILGDGKDGKVQITAKDGVITGVGVTNGGYDYTYGVVDLSDRGGKNDALLIPIIPPSKGHGSDIYQELGADRVLLYSRFDDSTKDFPIDTKFSQVGIIKNPEEYDSIGTTFTGNTFSSLYAAVLQTSPTVSIGQEITQDQDNGVVAKGYVASFDTETKVLKYYHDRSLVFGNNNTAIDNNDINDFTPFISSKSITIGAGSASIDTSVDNTSIITVDGKQIDTGVTFNMGLANPEINKKTGDILYINNRPVVERDSRQKEDIKIILEF